MIANPQRQQVTHYHLTLSVILLILTVYPYLFNTSSICCSVAAYSSDDFDLQHRSIEKFDIIESDDIILSKSISVRQVTEQLLHEEAINKDQQQQQQHISNEINEISKSKHLKRVQFSSLGRRFNLILGEPAQLVTDNIKIVTLDSTGKETIVPFNRNYLQILDGFVEGEQKSKATASFDKKNKLMTAQIRTGQDVFIVEPTYLHKDSLWSPLLPNTSTPFNNSNSKLYEKTMLVYKLQDHKQFQPNSSDNNLFIPGKLCAALNMSDYNYDSNNQETVPYNEDIDNIYKFYMPTENRKRNRRGIEFLLDQSKQRNRCTLHLVVDFLFYKHVGNGDLQTTINYLLALINRVNQIYLPTIWETGEDRTQTFSNIGFTVQNITIHQEFTRSSSDDLHYNTQSDKVWGARDFLDNFSRYSPPKHYCLAHLLTYRQFDSPVLGLAYVASARYGTIGGICSPMQQRGDVFYKHNTGISTSKGINGETLITRQADLVLAHELGHNLGAEHDSDECRPSPTGGGAYLMHPYSVMGFERNNRFLSNCSRLAIGKVLKRKASTCFVGAIENICGNGIVEDDEECDGGDVGHGTNDPCCDSSCRFTPGSQCSDRHSWCCSKCHIVAAGRSCRPAEEYNCKQASYCDGRSAECPPPPPVEDDKTCVGRGLCRSGDCVPFCEARELHSCLCNNPTDACKLCCKSSINGTCVPYDHKAPYLPDGVLCYRGVCEKGRCEQPIQDVVERLWDVIEDINFTTIVKFLRDNIILVVLVLSIPIWCIFTHFINEFDKHVREDVISAIMKDSKRRQAQNVQSPFLPRLFVGDDVSNTNLSDEIHPKDQETSNL